MLAILVLPSSFADAGLTFEENVRPIFKAYCFHCHGEEGRREGGLDVRLVRLLRQGGDSGEAIVPGNHDESYLYHRLAEGEMPPEHAQLRPTKEQIELIGRWIDAGAPTAGPEPENAEELPRISDQERARWAWQPIVRPKVPQAAQADNVSNPIDAFLLARLEQQGLTLNPEADRRTLIRRLSFDLTGLPPTPEDIDAFLGDDSPTAYEQLVDRLLDSPHYGERWGRHWLDIAGYADSEGFDEADRRRAWAWKYRDYVIASLNADKPFDQFIREQLAGDEMIGRTTYKHLTPEEIEKLTATGFLRMAPDGTGGNPDDPIAARNGVIQKTIEIVSTSLLGLTVACAQCHDHRFDPILQEDYYRLRAVFEPAFDVNRWRTPDQRLVSLATERQRHLAEELARRAEKSVREAQLKLDVLERRAMELAFEHELQQIPKAQRSIARQAWSIPSHDRTAEQNHLFRDYPALDIQSSNVHLHLVLFPEGRKLMTELENLRKKVRHEIRAEFEHQNPKWEYIRALTERPGPIPATHIFDRGDWTQPKEEVGPGDLTVLHPPSAASIEFPSDDPSLPTTGRRLAYARRLTDTRHPLVSRVLVNRVWMHHFGRGIVETPADLGTQGEPPTHPKLLDWLASEFMESGWSLKRLHKLIVTSAAYRQGSSRRPGLEAVDPQNKLYARMSVRRLDAECVRDAILAVSGELDCQQFGEPAPAQREKEGSAGCACRRSVYVESRRTEPLNILEVFDAPAMKPNCAMRTVSTVAPQSLTLMNSPFVLEQSEKFARRVLREAPQGARTQVIRAWNLAYGTEPTAEELNLCLALLDAQRKHCCAVSCSGTERADTDETVSMGDRSQLAEWSESTSAGDANLYALTCLCSVLFQSNQFLYVD